ncbi:MAG: response regulator [Opitutales bacterium]
MPADPPLPASSDGAAPEAPPCRILLVDDDRATRMLIHNVLKGNGFEVQEAASGEEAVKLLGAGCPDIVLLDVLMEGMDGFEACPALKKLPGMKDVPIIFLTGRSDTKAVLEGFKAGASDYITKPFRPPEALARIRTHLKVRDLIRQQRQNMADLEKANQAKNKMMSVVSHDLKNPIGAIRGLAEFLQDGSFGELSKEQKEMVRSIHSAADAMFGLVKDLLDVSLMDNDAISLNFAETDFCSLVIDAVNLHQVSAEKKKIEIRYDGPREGTPILCDRTQARRVLDNLVTNALKFSPSGTTVRVELVDAGEDFLLSVCDQGPGVPEDEKDQLFKHLGRTSNRPTGGEQSTGLGLAICKKIVEAHGGSIGFENQETGGARFHASFPLAPPKGFYARDDIPEPVETEDSRRKGEALRRMTASRPPFRLAGKAPTQPPVSVKNAG